MSAPVTSAGGLVAPPAALRIERVGRPSGDWDAHVAGDPAATFCHLSAWSRVMADTLDATPECLEARRNGELAGVLPLVRVRSLLLGDHLVSMPFLNYGGALGAADVRRALADEAARLGEALRASSVELRAREREGGTLLRPTDRKIIVELALPTDERAAWEGLRSKLRSQIRRPMKEGMTARDGAAELASFYAVYAANMRDLGTPVLPRSFFEAALDAFPERAQVLVVRHAGRAVAGGFGFFHEGEFEITWASSLREANHLSPNMLLYWELMRAAIARGARTFNFGRCTQGSGTHRFKLQWGGTESSLGWSSWPADARGGPPTADRPVFRAATAVWRRLPLPVANRLGPIVARWLP